MFESNDTFVEDAVKVKETSEDKSKKLAVLGLTAILLGASVTAPGIFQIIATFLFIVIAMLALIKFSSNNNVEYEYDYTNGSLEIAKIINNSKRKAVVTVESAQLKMVAAVGTNESLKYDHVKLKTYDCSAHDEEMKDYILVAHNEEKGYDFKVKFTPSDKLLTAMEKYNKRDIYRG